MSGPGPAAPDLAALVGSRLCHDLVSPLGAIGNGVELLRMIHDGSDELVLIEQAVASAQARLLLFRLAFGAATEDQQVRAADLFEALGALSLHGRIALHGTLDGALPRTRARRLALAGLCAETALAWGGTLTVAHDGVSAEAPRLRLEPALWQPLAAGTPPDDLAPASVHFALLAAGGPVSVSLGTEALSIRV